MYVFLAWMQLDITQTLFHGAGRLKSFCSGCLPSHVHLCWVMSKKFRAALVCLDKQAVVPVIWLCLPSYLCRGGQKKPLYDPNYKVVVHAVKLKRQVEMYQWVEYHESRDYQENGETKTETTYTYNTEWKPELVNSRNFDKEIGHQNPSAMAVESVMVVSPEVRTGPFILSKGLVEQINNFQTLSLGDFPVFNLDPFLSIHDDYFYHTPNPRRPEVGDVRVRFSFAGLSSDNSRHGPAQTVSIVAMQRGEQLLPFKTRSGDTLEILYLEELSAEEVFAREHQFNSMKTWGLRAAGWALMFLGIQLSMQIIYTLVDWVPVLRELVSIGLKIFALCVSCSLSLIVIGFGWLYYRPLVAVALGALAVLPIFLARSGLPAKKNA
uniref:Transmembrane protein 43 n=1 Tax=Astatotilapia calliptera TaxID=8154 RepID=A0AAX7SKF5_ASTCA